MSAVSVSEPGVRPILADAVDVARRALLELEPAAVGAHLGVAAEDDSAATHRFEATLPGYRGWQWAVVVAAPPGADYATVSESALLPGPDALVAPDFVPWEQRIRPGDLAPGDLLAPLADDPRLVPGYVATGDPVVDDVALEIGLGRSRVLSLEGREDAAQRWYGEYGPDTDMAKAAPSTCGLCGFYLPLAGSLRAAFGVCGNALAADGRVVHTEYGCGAHSDVVAPTGGGSPLYEAYDDAAYDVVPPEPVRARSETVETDAPGAEVTSESAATPVETEQPAEVVAETVASVLAPESNPDIAEVPATGETIVTNDDVTAPVTGIAPVGVDPVADRPESDAPTDSGVAAAEPAQDSPVEADGAEGVSPTEAVTGSVDSAEPTSVAEVPIAASGASPVGGFVTAGEPAVADLDVAHAEAAPTDAAPTDAAPTDAAPTDAAPTDAAPTDGAPTDGAPTDLSELREAFSDTGTNLAGAGSAPVAADVPEVAAGGEIVEIGPSADEIEGVERAVADSAVEVGHVIGAEFGSSPQN